MLNKITIMHLLKEIAFFLSPFILLGFILGYWMNFICLGLVTLLLWHLYHLIRLDHWLIQEKETPSPRGWGCWDMIYAQLYQRQKKSKKKLKKTQHQLTRSQNMAQSLPDALLVLSKDSAIVWFNQQAADLLGLRWPQDAGIYVGNLLRHPQFIDYIDSEKQESTLELPSSLHPDRILQYRFALYRRKGHQHKGRVILIRDVTHIRQLENMRQNFFANVSHELRTPMTVLQGYLEMAQDPNLLPKDMWNKAHKVMMEQLHRMNALTSQLLTLSKIEEGVDIDKVEDVDVSVLLEQLEIDAKMLGKDKQQQLTFDVDKKLQVKANKAQLQSVMSNLVYNAVKYTPNYTRIDIRWYAVPQGVRFEVTDTGDGIAPEHIMHLTERFYRVDKSRSRETGGNGLGLAIVKHILEHYNTILEIDSELGKGTTFAFTLPRIMCKLVNI